MIQKLVLVIAVLVIVVCVVAVLAIVVCVVEVLGFGVMYGYGGHLGSDLYDELRTLWRSCDDALVQLGTEDGFPDQPIVYGLLCISHYVWLDRENQTCSLLALCSGGWRHVCANSKNRGTWI